MDESIVYKYNKHEVCIKFPFTYPLIFIIITLIRLQIKFSLQSISQKVSLQNFSLHSLHIYHLLEEKVENQDITFSQNFFF